jgi:hypothetical protein
MSKPIDDPNTNAYRLGIAARLHIDPHRVQCVPSIGPDHSIHLGIRIDGRDPTGQENRLILEYLEEEFFGAKPRIVDK